MSQTLPDRHQRIRAIFHGAWERPAGERTAFLDGACGSDDQIRGEVERLLLAAGEDRGFLSGSAAEAAGLGPDVDAGSAPVPARIGRYAVIRLLGQGSMGSVYEAQQENPDRRVALKTVRPGLGSPSMLRRFEQEAQVLGRLRHPGIAQVHEAGVEPGALGPTPFIAMELVDGVPLDQWVGKGRPSRRERIEVLAQVCDAVQHAHGNGVVHRDLKPGNILVERAAPDGPARAKVLDFGVARLVGGTAGEGLASMVTSPGTLVGTLAYMSPEQVAGESESGPRVDARTDVYALGVLLFELLCGRLPRALDDKPIAEAARIIRDEEPLRAGAVDASLRGDLDTICQKAMERDPARRYQTAAELATDLRRYLTDEPIIARPATVMYQLRKFARRHRGLVAGLAAAALAIVIGIAGTLWYAIAAGRERARALEQQAAARWTSYRLSVAVGEEVDRNPQRALAQLRQAPEELRNWEWRHLAARLTRAPHMVATDPESHAACAFTNDGEPRASVVRSGRVEVVEPRSGRVLGAFPAPPGEIGTALNQGGTTLAVLCRAPGSVSVYDLRTGAQQMTQSFDGRQALAAGLSRDGSLLAVVVAGLGIEIYQCATGARIGGERSAINNAGYGVVEFSPDATSLLCSASAELGPSVQLHDLRGGTTSRTVGAGHSATFDPAGTSIACSTLGSIVLRDAQSLAPTVNIHGQFRIVLGLSFSADGTRLAGWVGKETVHLWDTRTGMLERAVTSPALTFVNAQAMNAAGDALLAAGPTGVALVPLQDSATATLRGHTSYVYLVAWSDDSQTVASAGWDGSVRIWDAASGHELVRVAAQPVEPLAPVAGVTYSTDGQSLLVLTHTTELLKFNRTDLAPAADGAVRMLAAPPPVAVSSAGVEAYWREARAGAKRVAATGGEREAKAAGGLVALTEKGVVIMIESGTGAARARLRADESLVYATAFSPDGRRLVTAGLDKVVRIWDVASGHQHLALREHGSQVFTLAFSPDGTRMVSGDGEGLILIWDTARWETVGELRGHTNYVHSLAFSPDGHTLCSGSGDGTLRLWRAPPVTPSAEREP